MENYRIKTQSYKYISILIMLIVFLACSSDDDNNSQQNVLIGQWEITSGFLAFGSDQFVYFNTSGVADILRQTEAGFKGKYSPAYSISGNEVTIEGTGGQGEPGTFAYTLENDVLTLDDGFRTIVLQKSTNPPDASAWITELSVLEEGNAPYEGEVDMAFTHDKSSIVYGKTNASNHITLINPNSFELVGQIATTRNASAVEIEKFNAANRYVFQSNNSDDRFYGYTEDLNELAVTSQELGAWIKGLASINGLEIWVASSNERSLYRYNYSTETIDETIELDISPMGLDYQDGLLYVSDGTYFHKCQVTPEFEVLESYNIPNLVVDGIAFDGANFWVNGYDFTADAYKIIKTDLTL